MSDQDRITENTDKETARPPKGLIARFINWLAQGAEKASKDGNLSCGG
ncbi:MAG: hypothetical protein V1793_01375 [Pseudomonadota bacterium]